MIEGVADSRGGVCPTSASPGSRSGVRGRSADISRGVEGVLSVVVAEE